MRRCVLVGIFVLATAGAAGADGGPTPGVMQGDLGVISHGVRYMALGNGRATVVEAVATRGGRVSRSTWVTGTYGFPYVTQTGQVEGLSRDGSMLVLAPFIGPNWNSSLTVFMLLNARTLREIRRVTLAGTFSYDALSPDGRTLYLIQYLSLRNSVHYLVRAYDLGADRLVKRVIFDRREKEPMTGLPVSRATGPGGRWVYTLYSKPRSSFVHALDTLHRRAVCVDLPLGRAALKRIWELKLALGPDGRTLAVRDRGRAVALVDTKTFEVKKA